MIGFELCDERGKCSLSLNLAVSGFARLRAGWRLARGHLCGLTFEVRRDRRWDARPARPMICLTASRAWRPAVGPRLDRGVRPRPAGLTSATRKQPKLFRW